MRETKQERIAYLEKLFPKYLRLLKRGDYNDARQVARSLEYETYEWSAQTKEWLAQNKEKRGN